MRYNYKRDLETFFNELKKPAGETLKGRTINQVGESILEFKTESSSLTTYFVDMEGGYHHENEFKPEQSAFLRNLYVDGKKYSFLCYPDIPADVMEILSYYADTHPDALNRLPLWKLARSGVTSRKIMWMLCYFLDCGVVAPDHIDIKKEDSSKWIAMYDEYFKEKKIETEFCMRNLPEKVAETIKAEAARIQNQNL